MGFPQLSNIAKEFYDTINSKAGQNRKVSGVMPWIRVTSTLGDFLSIESVSGTESFSTKYGNTERSGRIGINKMGESVFAENDNRGYRPSPTINSISVTQGNEGLSKKISFTIVGYSLGQAELLMQHFLEPAKMVLVEWGENTSLSVSQKTQLDTCEIAAYNNLSHIQEKRANSNGTYDAVLGTITGGESKFGSNETYEISVELTSIGELPAYLQYHKNIVGNSVKEQDTGKVFTKKEIRIKANETNEVGTACFMQMYNDLPQYKRTEEIKNLKDLEWVVDPINYVNIDKEIQEDLVEGFSGDNFKLGGEKYEFPSDSPLFSDKRFIRCALAFHILDMQPNVNLEPVDVGCDKTNSPSGRINWRNTICRAHPHMFSADSNYLYIPNSQAPNFDFTGALKASEEFSSPIPKLENLKQDKYITDIHPGGPGAERYSYFPNLFSLVLNDQKEYDNQYLAVEADAFRWGYLKDLYINFDFFCECIQSPGLLTKELWYKILNGLSSSVNLYWDFQIVPRGVIPTHFIGSNEYDKYIQWVRNTENVKTGDEELQIVDVSFMGKTPKGVGTAKFQSRGLNTPFLEASFNMDIPGAMKGQVIGNSLSKTTGASNPNAESKEIDFDGLFSNKTDSVLEKLNSIREKVEASENSNDKWAQRYDELIEQGYQPHRARRRVEYEKREEEEKRQDELKKSNFEVFVGTATVVPSTQDRNADRDIASNFFDWYKGNNVSLDEIMVICAWNDPNLLKMVQRFDDGYLGSNEGVTQQNLPLLPIKFDFTIHGVSGIRVGDTFNINDLPLQYKKKVFQVTQVEHEISQNIWTTKVSGQLRNMDATEELPYEYKKPEPSEKLTQEQQNQIVDRSNSIFGEFN